MSKEEPTTQPGRCSSQQVTQCIQENHGRPNIIASDVVDYCKLVVLGNTPHEQFVPSRESNIKELWRRLTHWPRSISERLLRPESAPVWGFDTFQLPLSVMTAEDSFTIKLWNFGCAFAILLNQRHRRKALHVDDDIFSKTGVTRENAINGICPTPAQPNGEASPNFCCQFPQIRTDGETIVLLHNDKRWNMLDTDKNQSQILAIKASLHELCWRWGLQALATMSAEEYGLAAGIDIDQPLNEALVNALHEARGGGQNDCKWNTFSYVLGYVMPYARQLYGREVKSILRSVYSYKLKDDEEKSEAVKSQAIHGNAWQYSATRGEFYRDLVIVDGLDEAKTYFYRYVSLLRTKNALETSLEPSLQPMKLEADIIGHLNMVP